ncbi:nickel transporter [Grosmannia clavigera kw1407]|uniref:Nickel/cobalt efflux system n=1 Tax=Grosmannia clavigera (strain kw1407 / UAMH 11150) TaxID=655863 RepID=F0XPJ2_GROCL|nr:nickel transporter [Grosmannia clavigera kw1407]EFX00338.1 nickel transporter [Grosmannia clavigera kw1407]
MTGTSFLHRAGLWLQPRIPRKLHGLPLPALALISLLVVVNVLVWAVVAVVLRFYPRLMGSAVLAYTLGLRHALDADHISAIDLMTRRLIAAGQRPVAVGTFFSLGHSTIVVITCVVVAATSGALRDRFHSFERVGNIIGTSVSAAVLLILCVGNAWVLWRLVRGLREELRTRGAGRVRSPENAALASAGSGADEGDADRVATHDIEAVVATTAGTDARPNSRVGTAAATSTPSAAHLHLEGGGLLVRLFRRLFVLIDRPWKMYPLGLLFGLGFDTSSEVALLGIASLQGSNGTSMWLILILPMLFTAGMCLVDSSDGALMMTLYTSKVFSRDTVAILYYSVVLTGITIVVAAFIGVVQVLTLVDNVASPEGRFWDGVGVIGDNFDVIGGSICGLFLIVGIGSVLVYKPWRQYLDRRTTACHNTVSSD